MRPPQLLIVSVATGCDVEMLRLSRWVTLSPARFLFDVGVPGGAGRAGRVQRGGGRAKAADATFRVDARGRDGQHLHAPGACGT